jgi:trimeric autotransporter adhesin
MHFAALTSGDDNVAVGFSAGTALTTGEQNTLIGSLAGDALTDADYNVAVGKSALSSDTLGSRHWWNSGTA